MRTLALVLVLSLASFASFSSLVVQDASEPQEPPAERAWLQQLVGEWDVTTEAEMGPGMDPMRWEGSESVRSLGDLWVIAENTASMGGEAFRAILTLGYDERKEAFVGTWVDTMQSHLWVYRGELDEERKILSLTAEGPSFSDPSAMSTYRDSIEVVSPDHKVLRAAVQGDDGTWTTFMEAHYRRKE